MASNDAVIEVISTYLGRDGIEPSNRLRDDLGMESLDVANLITAFRDRFQLTIYEEETLEVRTVQDLCDLIERKQQEAAP